MVTITFFKYISPSAPLYLVKLFTPIKLTQISTVYRVLWLHYIMQQETVQVLLDPPLPSALPLLHFWEGEEGLAARLTSQGLSCMCIQSFCYASLLDLSC